jgi:uracil-DNA glycosylase
MEKHYHDRARKMTKENQWQELSDEFRDFRKCISRQQSQKTVAGCGKDRASRKVSRKEIESV